MYNIKEIKIFLKNLKNIISENNVYKNYLIYNKNKENTLNKNLINNLEVFVYNQINYENSNKKLLSLLNNINVNLSSNNIYEDNKNNEDNIEIKQDDDDQDEIKQDKIEYDFNNKDIIEEDKEEDKEDEINMNCTNNIKDINIEEINQINTKILSIL